MKYRTFGKLDWQVSALGFGVMRLPTIDGDYAKVDEPEAVRIVEKEGSWGIHSGKTLVSTVGTEIEASSVLEIIRKYQPTHFCWIGDQESQAMTYLRR